MTRNAIIGGSIAGFVVAMSMLLLPQIAAPQTKSPPPKNSRAMMAPAYTPVGTSVVPSTGTSYVWFIANTDSGQYPVACYAAVPDAVGVKMTCYRGSFQ